MKSVISSEVISGNDCRFFSLVDTSVYNSDLEITNPIYKIILPNFSKFVEVVYEPKKVTTVNSNLLLLTTNELGCLPDGLYIIEQSICPNDKLFKKFNYYHTCTADTNLANLICECPEDIEKLWRIRMELDDVKSLAKCGEIEKANMLYRVISNKLELELKSCDCGMWM